MSESKNKLNELLSRHPNFNLLSVADRAAA